MRSAAAGVCAADILEDLLKHLKQKRPCTGMQIETVTCLLSASPALMPKLSFKISSMARTMKFTTGGGV